MIEDKDLEFLNKRNKEFEETYKQREKSKFGDVRVEARVEKLEIGLQDMKMEIHILNRTMQDVAQTLKEIREDQKKIQAFEVEKALLSRDIKELKSRDDLIFQKVDKINETLNGINIKEAGNDVKLSHSERVVWLIVAGAIGALGWFKNA